MPGPLLEVDIDMHMTATRHWATALPEGLGTLFISIKIMSLLKHRKVKFITCQTFLVENANKQESQAFEGITSQIVIWLLPRTPV